MNREFPVWTWVLGALLVSLTATIALADPLPAASAGTASAGATTASIETPNMPPSVRNAIREGMRSPEHREQIAEKINASQQQGILGIPGAPSPNYFVGFLWAIWVGWIFSTVGAFGGIMAGVGHITIFGLGDYARSFGKTNPMNAMLTDCIRVSNQWMVGMSALISVSNYYRMGRLVLPVGLSLAIGSVAGSFLIPRLTAGRVNLKDYIGVFGIIVLALGGYLFYQTTERGRASKQDAKRAADAFEKQRKEGGPATEQGVKVLEGSVGFMAISLAIVLLGSLWGDVAADLFSGSIYVAYAVVAVGFVMVFFMPKKRIRFTFSGVEFSFLGYVPAVGGAIIAGLASFLGIGGGFLLVPFLTTVGGLPMFLVAGTSALAVLVGMIVSIFTYMVGKGVAVPWGLIGVELAGIFVGSMIGPRTQKYIPDIWLKRIFVLLAAYVGLRYTSKGFFGVSILPPF
jgi:uncharacterized protein